MGRDGIDRRIDLRARMRFMRFMRFNVFMHCILFGSSGKSVF